MVSVAALGIDNHTIRYILQLLWQDKLTLHCHNRLHIVHRERDSHRAIGYATSMTHVQLIYGEWISYDGHLLQAVRVVGCHGQRTRDSTTIDRCIHQIYVCSGVWLDRESRLLRRDMRIVYSNIADHKRQISAIP